MNEEPSEQETGNWRRRFGVQANNRAWTLAKRSSLEAEEKTESQYAAYAAAISEEPELHREHYLKARTLGEGLKDLQGKELFLATFKLIPAPWTKGGG